MILDRISEHATYEPLHPLFKEAFEFLKTADKLEPGKYQLSHGMYVNVQPEITTKSLDEAQFEAHKNFIDLQYVFEGTSVLTWAPTDTLTPTGEYNPTKDVVKLAGEGATIQLKAGDFFIVWPNDGHKPNAYFTEPNKSKVFVAKIPVEVK